MQEFFGFSSSFLPHFGSIFKVHKQKQITVSRHLSKISILFLSSGQAFNVLCMILLCKGFTASFKVQFPFPLYGCPHHLGSYRLYNLQIYIIYIICILFACHYRLCSMWSSFLQFSSSPVPSSCFIYFWVYLIYTSLVAVDWNLNH